MQVPTGFSGQMTVIHNGALKNAKTRLFQPGVDPYPDISVYFSIEGAPIPLPDYNDALDVYYSMSDDGHVWYDAIRVLALAPMQTVVAIPDVQKLRSGLVGALKPLLRDHDQDPDNISYARLILMRPECVYADFAARGNEAAAQKALVRRLFRI